MPTCKSPGGDKPRVHSAPSDRDLQWEEDVPSEQTERREVSAPVSRDKRRGKFTEIIPYISEDSIRQISEEYNVPETSVIPVISCKDKELRFIVYSDLYNRETYRNFDGLRLILKNPNIVSREASDVIEKCQSQNCYLTPEQRTELKDIIQLKAKEWFLHHSNLNIISMSPVKSKGGEMEMDHPCIVLYCTSKGYIPVREKDFPRTVSMADKTVDIDVREGYFQFGYNTKASNLRHDTLRMGCEFSVENGQNSGTIGPFVDYQGQLAFLTCAHTIFGIDSNGYDNKKENPFVQQPAFSFPAIANRCGQVRRAVFSTSSPNASVDAAVVAITEQERIPSRGEFAIAKELQYRDAGFDVTPYYDSGKIHDDPSMIDNDLPIVKFGAETHMTRGVLNCDGTVVRSVSENLGMPGSQQKVIMSGQIEIRSVQARRVFFQAGDSGAGVFYVDESSGQQELVCIGMAIGCTSYGNGIVTPIADILRALEITPPLKSFPSNP